ncbi:MAG: hypothetical protein IH614_14475, partial [Desulfuromonadales bacterium]|nr:hypothetical protein [Desulfuromonadales bacterium]
QPTHAITGGFNLGYTRNQQDTGNGMSTVEEIVPSANLNLVNDIFRAGLSGTFSESRRSRGEDQNAYSWQATLGNSWQRAFWPNLSLNYGESADKTKNQDAEGAIDNHSSQYGLGFDWDLLLARFFYAFSHYESEEMSLDSRSAQDSHLVRVESGGSFWQNRINVQVSHQSQFSDSEFSALIPEGETFARELEDGVILSRVVDPVVSPDLELVELAPTPFLQDDDREGAAGAVLSLLPLERGHFGVRFDSRQQVDLLYIYLDPFSPLTPGQIDVLRWDIYTRDPLNDLWELRAENIPVVFNRARNRLELAIARQEREFQVVVTNLAGVTVAVTEIEAISLLTEGVGSRQTSHLSTASLRVRLTETVTAASNLTLEKTEAEAGESESDTTRQTVTGTLRWAPSPYVAPSIGYSESRQETTGELDALLRSYSLIVATFPLPTLNVTLGATRSDRYAGSQKTTTTDSYSLNSTALIYPDLSAAFNATYTTNTREQDEAAPLVVDTFSSRLNLNARINPKLTADLTTNYFQSESSTNTSSSADSVLSLAYRPSDLLSMRLTGSRRWSGTDIPDTLAFNLNLALLRTYKTRATFRYSHARGDGTSNNFGLDGSWDISRSLALQARGNYSLAETDTWNVQASLAFRL